MPRHLTLTLLLLLTLSASLALAQETAPTAAAPKPSLLIITGAYYFPGWPGLGDFDIFKQLVEKEGIQVDMWVNDKSRPLDWDLIRKYTALVIISPPDYKDQPFHHGMWTGPPDKAAFDEMLKQYLAAGGGVFWLLFSENYPVQYNLYNDYLMPFGAKLMLEEMHDPQTEAVHSRLQQPFLYADAVPNTPVTAGVSHAWIPIGYSYATTHTQPLEFSKAWTEVLKGGPTSYSEPRQIRYAELEPQTRPFAREGKTPQPAIMAIREAGGGRMAAACMWGIFHLYGGKTWIHDGAVWDKGFNNKPSDFGKLFINTIRWLSEPGLKSGQIGGYVQDPLQLVHPHFRKTADELIPQFDSYQNPTPPGQVYKGLIGARTSYSGGKGTAAEYAAAAKRAGLSFVIFLEDFSQLKEADLRKLEADCKDSSDKTLLLLPGYRLQNNVGNNMFLYGHELPWPKPSQLENGRLRLQCKDKDGNLALSDEDAKNVLWACVNYAAPFKNIGYYDFTNEPGMPARDLRLVGLFGVMTYRDGKLIEDLTKDYISYCGDGQPLRAGAVDLVDSPAALEDAVRQNHYLTHVAAYNLAQLPEYLAYGHFYGRPNTYPSNGPQIRAWGGTLRFITYAGESFVTARRLAPVECWVTSDAGLKEILIYTETRPYRRFLPNGAKEFHQTFQWAYDRHRELVMVVTDLKGNRAISTSRSLWADANANTWCGDRQNGELWHGPLTFPGPRTPQFSAGPTWDGGPPPPARAAPTTTPAARGRDPERYVEAYYPGVGGRLMEGHMYPTCYDDSVANAACLGDHIYAPGIVANAYHTLGPVFPSKQLTFTVRRTQFLQRGAGPMLGGHVFYPERTGGCLAVMEGAVTLKQPVMDVAFACLYTAAFPPNSNNYALWAINTGDGTGGLGRINAWQNFDQPPLLAGLGPGNRGSYLLKKGGYVAMLPSALGLTSVLFNLSDDPLLANPVKAMDSWFIQSPRNNDFQAGEVVPYRYLFLYDPIDEPALNTMRIEALRKYLGLTGENGCGLVVKRGKVLSQWGINDLAPENGVIEFEVPNPGWRVNQPLPFRFTGFNPNWTVGQLQVQGYSPGFYTDGRNVYRQIALDDRNQGFLSVYPDHAPRTVNLVGHPVQCDNPDLIIEVTQMSVKPLSYHVAVNNPTDAPIKATLKKTMDLPGFEFPDTPVEVAAGGYLVVKDK